MTNSVFISYSHGLDDERVLALARRLRADGLDVRLDQDAAPPPEGWRHWAERQLVDCDFVLAICTLDYSNEFDSPRYSRGSLPGMPYVVRALCDHGVLQDSLVPVILPHGPKHHELSTGLHLRSPCRLPDAYRALLQRLLAPRPSAVENVLAPAWEKIVFDELVREFCTPERAALLSTKAGIPSDRVPPFAVPLVFWVIIKQEAASLPGGLRPILAHATEMCPENPAFARATFLSENDRWVDSQLTPPRVTSKTGRRAGRPRTRRSGLREASPQFRVFLSYARAQAVLAERITIALRAEGHEVFFDRDTLKLGDAFHAKIRHELRSSDALIFLVSPESVASDSYACTELKIAKREWSSPASRILPVMAEPTPADSIPPLLREINIVHAGRNVVVEVAYAVDILAQANAARIWREARAKSNARRWRLARGSLVVMLVLILTAGIGWIASS